MFLNVNMLMMINEGRWNSKNLTTNQGVGSSNLSGRTIKIKGLQPIGCSPFLFCVRIRVRNFIKPLIQPFNSIFIVFWFQPV